MNTRASSPKGSPKDGMSYSYMGIDGVYHGEIKNGVPHGLGEYTYSDENDATNNLRIQGTWHDGVLISGTRHQSDECVFTGFFHANGQVREGTMTFSGGVEFHGTFNDEGEFKHGRMTHIGIDGNGWYEGDFVDGIRNGTGELHEDGVIFTGTWKDDILHGKGTMALPNGTIYDGMWNDHHFDGSILYSNGVNREFIGYLKHDGEKAVGHSEDMSVTNSDHHLTYEGKFEDNMPVGVGSIAWFGKLFNVTLPVFSHAFTSFCIVSPKQYRQLIQAGVLEQLEDPISLEVIGADTPKFHLLHFGLKLDQTADVQLWHPVDILVVVAMELNACPLCRLDYPRPLMDWIKREARKVQTNAATKIQRFVRNRTRSRSSSRIKKRASAATKIQRFVRSRQHKTRRKSHGGTKRSDTKRSDTKRSDTKRSDTKRSDTKRSDTERKSKRTVNRR
jgi:hypothetical protein